MPTSLIKSCSTVFWEIIFNLANLSISQGSFPLKFKLVQITPLLKQPGLDKNNPSNYRPISNLNKVFQITWVSHPITHPTPYNIFLQFQPFPISISALLSLLRTFLSFNVWKACSLVLSHVSGDASASPRLCRSSLAPLHSRA